jgi:hypothetical protein
MDTIAFLQNAALRRITVLCLRVRDLHHAFFLGLNCAIAEYHLRKADQARFDKRYRDGLYHLLAFQRHGARAQIHNIQLSTYTTQPQAKEFNAVWAMVLHAPTGSR